MRIRRRLTRTVAVISVLTLAMTALASTPAVSAAGKGTAHHAITAPPARVPNPPANIAPVPNFTQSGTCSGGTGAWNCVNPCVSATLKWTWRGPACDQYVLLAINHARHAMRLAPMVLPSNWSRLSPAEQVLVVVNLERIALHMAPYLGLNGLLTASALRASHAFGDPVEVPSFPTALLGGVPRFGSAWADNGNVLTADYFWMYDDGWGGSAGETSNLVCTSATDPGCWGHRDELLGADPGFNSGVGTDCTTCEMGAAYTTTRGGSLTALVQRPVGRPPAMYFTWASERRFFTAARTPTSTTTTTTPGAALPVGTPAAGAPSGFAVPSPSAMPGYVAHEVTTFAASTLPSGWRTYAGQPGGDPGAQFARSHVTLSHGVLMLSAFRDPAYANRWVTGGLCDCGDPVTYGAFFVRSRVTGPGPTAVALLWPASNSWPPEVDFSETNGSTTSSTATLHWSSVNHIVQRTTKVNLATWHTWGVIWTPTAVHYVLDGRVWASVTAPAGVPHVPMTLDLQQQTWCASGWACPTHPQSMEVAWVAIYTPATAPVSPEPPTTTTTAPAVSPVPAP